MFEKRIGRCDWWLWILLLFLFLFSIHNHHHHHPFGWKNGVAAAAIHVPSAATEDLLQEPKQQEQQVQGEEIVAIHKNTKDTSSSSSSSSFASPPPLRRALPEKVLVGYATHCNKDDIKNNNNNNSNNENKQQQQQQQQIGGVPLAVQQGVNVVIWAFYNIQKTTTTTTFLSSLDLDCIQSTIVHLDELGYKDTVHLVSMGGWNGPHLDTKGFQNNATEWFTTWKTSVGHIFHGIDIDIEGNDNLTSPNNYFSINELEMMGEIIKLFKNENYIVTIVPPQSYLDVSSRHFSQYVNLTRTNDDDHNDDPWHDDFSYFGQNVYAYWLAQYGNYIDLVMIQFYESYSRAAKSIYHEGITPENYLQQYVWDLNTHNQTFFVDFENKNNCQNHPSLLLRGKQQEQQSNDVKRTTQMTMTIPSQNVSLPISQKLVWGFGNGWAKSGNNNNNDDNRDKKNVYFPSECIQAAYQSLWDWMIEPRGFMFWNIDQEGLNDVYYAKELNEILHIRQQKQQRQRSSSTLSSSSSSSSVSKKSTTTFVSSTTMANANANTATTTTTTETNTNQNVSFF